MSLRHQKNGVCPLKVFTEKTECPSLVWGSDHPPGCVKISNVRLLKGTRDFASLAVSNWLGWSWSCKQPWQLNLSGGGCGLGQYTDSWPVLCILPDKFWDKSWDLVLGSEASGSLPKWGNMWERQASAPWLYCLYDCSKIWGKPKFLKSAEK